MPLELKLETNLPWLVDRIIYLTRSGSQAYGTATPDSDSDVRGIAVPPLEYYFGFLNGFDHADFSEPADLSIYDLRKFFRLAASANANVLELLYTEPADRLYVHPIMETMLSRRDEFLGRDGVERAFSGFARKQLRLLTAKRTGPHPDRNPKRLELERAHGYDTKHGMHVVRILRMGMEILRGEGVKVRRPDAEELLSIRYGAWPLERLVAWAEDAEAELHRLAASSKLPAAPDRVALDKLCVDMVAATFDHEIRVPVMATGFASQSWTFGAGVLSPKKLTAEG